MTSGSLCDLEAQEAAIALCNTLEACLVPTPQQIIRVANRVTQNWLLKVGLCGKKGVTGDAFNHII